MRDRSSEILTWVLTILVCVILVVAAYLNLHWELPFYGK